MKIWQGHPVPVTREVKVAIEYHNYPQPSTEQRPEKYLLKRLLFDAWKDDYSGCGGLSEGHQK